MLLTELEAKAFEFVRENEKASIRAICEALDKKEPEISRVVHRLRTKGAIHLVNRRYGYKVLIDEYSIGEEPPSPQEEQHPIDVDTSAISAEMREYVRAHAPYLRRSVLARRTGIPKVKLNQLLIELSEGKRHA